MGEMCDECTRWIDCPHCDEEEYEEESFDYVCRAIRTAPKGEPVHTAKPLFHIPEAEPFMTLEQVEEIVAVYNRIKEQDEKNGVTYE